jgi:site-specific DNA-cytosine methylase
LNIIVACEFSGTVRDAFIAEGHTAISCDLLPTERPGNHIQGDIRTVDIAGYDLLIAHPPCTYLASSGARWWKDRHQEQQEAIDFVKWIATLSVPKIAIENPIGKLSKAWRKPDQIIQPWQFGHGETKATCLWLKGLPVLQPTNIVDGRVPRIHWTSSSKMRWKLRSRTYEGIAQAMAQQWGKL